MKNVYIYRESQNKRNDSFLTIKRLNMDGFSKVLILAARKLRELSFDTLFRFVRWKVGPKSSFQRRVSEKKSTDFGPNRFRGFFAQNQFRLT